LHIRQGAGQGVVRIQAKPDRCAGQLRRLFGIRFKAMLQGTRKTKQAGRVEPIVAMPWHQHVHAAASKNMKLPQPRSAARVAVTAQTHHGAKPPAVEQAGGQSKHIY
jgi:hypothetical protein